MKEATDTRNKCTADCDKSVNGYCTSETGGCGALPPQEEERNDMVNKPAHYQGKIEVIDYIRDKLTPEGFTEYCCGNVLKYISLWRKKDGVQDLKKAQVYLGWMIESAEREARHENPGH